MQIAVIVNYVEGMVFEELLRNYADRLRRHNVVTAAMIDDGWKMQVLIKIGQSRIQRFCFRFLLAYHLFFPPHTKEVVAGRYEGCSLQQARYSSSH